MNRMNQEQDLRRERALEELLGRAEPRPVPPREDEEIIRRVVRTEWDRVTIRRVSIRRITQFALAASVLLAVFAGLSVLRSPVDGVKLQQVATIEKQFGTITMRKDGGTVEIGSDSGLTLAWHDGGSLRLDQNTRVDFESGSEIYLKSGRIYFDSMPSGVPTVITDPERAKFTIRTDAGTVRHYGTQYMTQTDGNELEVLVREGRVSIEAAGVSEAASVGEKLTVKRDGRAIVETISISGGDWQWIEKTSPSFTLDNRPIIEFLTWVSRETGQPLRFESSRAERVVRSEELRGVVELEPSRALPVYMPTIAVSWRIEDGAIVIGDGGT
jgi:ferric-dicitrate binding protein FerR (iron transport regulator)